LTLRYDKFSQKNVHQTLSESVWCYKTYDKTFWCVNWKKEKF